MRLISKSHFVRRSRSGMTLIEILITSFIASIALSILVTLTIFATRSVMAITNYTELDQDSRNTLDLLTRDIRQASSIETNTFSTKKIVLINPDGTKCTYAYSTNGGGSLSRKIGTGSPQVLLTNCDQLTFAISTRSPLSGFKFDSASNNVALAKLIDVSWKCSRKIKGEKVNTESIQTAKIVMRN